MGMDFVAFLKIANSETAVRNIGLLIDNTLAQFTEVNDKRNAEGYAESNDLTPGWFDISYDPPVRIVKRTNDTNTDLFFRTPEGFEITIGNHCIRIYHCLRWQTFLTESSWQKPMIDACISVASLSGATDCIITSDYSPLNDSFFADEPFDSLIEVDNPEDGEKLQLAELYQEAADDTGIVIKADSGQWVPLVYWKSRGFWRVPNLHSPTSIPTALRARPSQQPRQCSDKEDETSHQYDKLSPVSSNGRYGFIDEKGTLAISLQFDDAGPFVNGRATVKLGKKWSCIDSGGNSMDTPLGWPGKEWPRPPFEAGKLMTVRQYLTDDGQYGFACRTSEKLVIPAEYNDAHEFSEGLAAVKPGHLWGFVDEVGSMRITPSFADVGDFHDGLVAVSDKTGRWGYINQTGTLVVDYQFEVALDFINAVGRVRRNGRWGYLDPEGKWLWEPRN